MKTHQLTLATLLLIFFLTSNSEAQTIDSLAIIPTNPNTTDTIKVISYTFHPYSDCPLTSSSVNINNDTITVYASHTLGLMPATCNSIDTLTIGILNAGTYELTYHLFDTVPPTTYDIDTIIFTVQQIIGPTINSLTIIPTNPTTNDTVKVISYTTFLTSDCFLIGSSININNDTITVYVSHLIGGWPAICNSIDTLTIGKLNTGVYELNYHLSDTLGPTTHDIDTIIFVVQQPSGIKITNYSEHRTKVYPNPTSQRATLEFDNSKNEKYTLIVYDSQGRLVQTITDITTNKVEIEKRNLTSGLYFFQLRTDREVRTTGRLTIE